MRTEVAWRRFADWAKRRAWVLSLASQFTRGRGQFRVIDRLWKLPTPSRPLLSGWDDSSLAACWLGHATCLLRIAGKTILTDPVFSHRIGLGFGLFTMGPRRVMGPALQIDDLPEIDVIAISHAHLDHLDRPSLHRLARRFPDALLVAIDGSSDLLADLGFARYEELFVDPRRGETVLGLDRLEIRTIPTRHWGARTFADTNRSWGAFLFTDQSTRANNNQNGLRILFGSDSAMHNGWDILGADGGVNLAIIGIGAYDPWIEGHANPEQALAMARACGARHMMPIHHSTFVLSREPLDEPLDRLIRANESSQPELVGVRPGEVWFTK